nr:zinc finger, CCHC-type [Tanacetum cinerariifolium]
MNVATMKHMASNFAKLDKFEGVDFRRWQKKMHFLLSSMNVVYVLTTLIPEDGGDDATVEQIMKRAKWDNDDYVLRGLILNGMSNSLFDIYQNVESSKELWDSSEAKYMAEDASSKKFLVSNFTNYKMTHSRPVMEQYNELFGILGRFTQHKMNMDEAIQDDDVAWWVDSGATVHVCKDRCWVPNKRNMITLYELWTKRKPNLNYLKVWGCRAVVRLPDPKLKTLGERGFECIFVGYADHSKAFRLYVIEPNDSVAINSIIESRDAIFDDNRLSLVPRPSLSIPKGTEDGGSVVTDKVVQQQLRKSKRNRTPKDFGPEFQLYLIEGTRDEVSDQHSYCFNIEDDTKTFDEVMKSQDVAFWKEEINDEMDSIMGNNTWVLADLRPEIDYFDTYAPVARISTIRLLIAMASIHNLVIHQMDVKTAFLNGDLDEEVYMNQPQGFIMPGNKNKVCKLIKSLYGLKQAPKQWHQKFDEVVLSNGEFLSSRFSMKDMRETDVILVIRIKHESNGIAVSQSHYIKKVPKKFNYFDCTPVSTPMDTSEKLMVRYTSNPGTQHWQAIQRVLKYLKKTIDYRLTYNGYPSVLEGYTDASWIRNSSTSGWVFLLGGGAIFWASKKQTCITGSTMESEFVALAAASKEAEWLKNLLHEIPLWSKPIAHISIRCDTAATLAKAYSQMYNGKSRHLGVRHSMIRELITNGVISIEFVRSQQNLADHLTKGLVRDLVIKSAEGMGLKSN